MNKQLLEETLWEYCHKIIDRFNAYHNRLHKTIERKNSYFTVPKYTKQINRPAAWTYGNLYDPYYVLKHRRGIAHAVAKAIAEDTYIPTDPHQKHMPKKDGGVRIVNEYTIPDQVVSYLLYRRLLSKNKHRFSSFSYAYRNDRNVHYAVQDITVDINYYGRLFIAEFDFRKFFDSIGHDFIFSQFQENGFVISDNDELLIHKFLAPFEKGIPQGTSISLFLANLTCWQLDKNLEAAGLKFARYAYDTIIWSADYARICLAYGFIDAFSKKSSVDINYTKSDGISLLIKQGMKSELVYSKEFIEFIGYRIGFDRCGIKNTSFSRIKTKIGYLLYSNLIQPIKNGTSQSARLPTHLFDPALLSAIMQIRRYLYGNLNEYLLSGYQKGRIKHLRVDGLIAFYPLVTDQIQMKDFDGWLVSAIYRAM